MHPGLVDALPSLVYHGRDENHSAVIMASDGKVEVRVVIDGLGCGAVVPELVQSRLVSITASNH